MPDIRRILVSRMTLRFINIVTIFLLLFLVNGCATKKIKRSDGPPNFYVDETKIPNAVPKKEPLAKYGNMKFYHVFGKRYYTLQSSKNYEAVGTASWYGKLFHERRTSSGEPYDMLGMTAAHKTLPLPTYVEVTNLQNNRKIIVKVNDRGPFEGSRLIDLSYVAAKKLGMLGKGTAQVKIKALNFEPTFKKDFYLAQNKVKKQLLMVQTKTVTKTKVTQPVIESAPMSGSVYLQVGAFKNKLHAEKLRQRLVSILETPVNISKGKFYRVKVGPLRDVATANKITHQLKGMGIDSNRIK